MKAFIVLFLTVLINLVSTVKSKVWRVVKLLIAIVRVSAFKSSLIDQFVIYGSSMLSENLMYCELLNVTKNIFRWKGSVDCKMIVWLIR